MKLYTRTGDSGLTGLIGGQRVDKDHVRVVAYGEVDELNAVIGLVAAACIKGQWGDELTAIQEDLFRLGAQLATGDGASPAVMLDPHRIPVLEQAIDQLQERTESLKNFVLPGGCELAARLHLGRTVCRRAERAVVHLSRAGQVGEYAVVYLNRLSDLLFAMALAANEDAGVPHRVWTGA